MTLDHLGSIGEFVAAIATLITLIYLAFQLRQNTRALRATAFQSVVSEMGKNVEPLLNNADLVELFIKCNSSPEILTAAERVRVNALYLATFRRLESVYVQYTLGTMELENKLGFEESIIPLLHGPYAEKWWGEAKKSFYAPYVRYIEEQIAGGQVSTRSPSMQL
ncbi:hypothetical protein FV139_15380 [Parahaliea maris]|uniref:DUF4760 domain-containing protein n=1 Tax=Parahaliea maris TaxID=2716870 RepID=A0A5C8ZUC0_9GAMM|nr:hypothetical protein [Parahaliea maris]TXS92103.1 hypothetical protein FV139_15380 [Parahaliea maris]